MIEAIHLSERRGDAAATYTTKFGGTRLGLAIVQEIVTAHGGQITVQSIEGQGTTLSITLSRLPADAPAPDGLAGPVDHIGPE